MKPFRVRKDTTEFSYDLEEENGRPMKLGDGSFGIVLKIRMLGNVPGALKLFYANDQPNMTARRKFEITLGEEIVRKEKMSNEVIDKSGLILPEAICENFKDSEAYHAHEKYFRSTGIELSGEGVVMPFFDCTLKDLLERGAPAGRLCNNQVISTASAPGYEVISKLSSTSREACILPILRQIALALQSLHAFDLHHHDLKPANILLKSEGGTLKAALGDFGFTDPNINQSTIVDLNDAAMALGTRHYRSVEQKDYFDVCEADVDLEVGKEKTVTATLRTQDAKFYDSIIEAGDLCVFRKDSERNGWPIAAIERKKDDPTFSTTIVLKPIKQQAGIAPDRKTQVAFLKTQTHRTDLFGFGAVAFDMLTAGKSPERFYDLLRPLDRFLEDAQEGQIATIENAYQKFIRSPSAEPQHRALFSELKTGSTFPSPKFVGMLLKCMLSKPKDSFFSAHRTSAGAFRALTDAVKELIDQHNAWVYLPDIANPLWNGGTEGPRLTKTVSGFADTLRSHRSELKKSPGALRLSAGYRLLRALYSTVTELIKRHRTKKSYFTPLDPFHLNGDGTFDENSVAYSTEGAFFEALRSGEAVNFRDEIEGNNFLPPHMRYRTRFAVLTARDGPNDPTRPKTKYAVSYSESVPFWLGIQDGDFLRTTIDTEPIQLFTMKKVDDDAVELEVLLHRGRSGQKPITIPTEFKAQVVKQVIAVDYYLSVLAIYIHQLFFVTESRVFEPIPSKVWLLEEAAWQGMLDWNTLAERCKPDRTGKESLSTVQREAAKLYTWLLMRLYKIGGGSSESADLLAKVADRVQRLEEKIAIVLGRDRYWLENATDEDIKGVASAIDQKTDKDQKQLESLETLLGKIVTRDCFQESESSAAWSFLS